ncbi:hypothetical protein HK405_013846 [Cladochytrium tenue]|nr:hypothetical protein HK405_013846 [Cladochytrium tenue]
MEPRTQRPPVSAAPTASSSPSFNTIDRLRRSVSTSTPPFTYASAQAATTRDISDREVRPQPSDASLRPPTACPNNADRHNDRHYAARRASWTSLTSSAVHSEVSRLYHEGERLSATNAPPLPTSPWPSHLLRHQQTSSSPQHAPSPSPPRGALASSAAEVREAVLAHDLRAARVRTQQKSTPSTPSAPSADAHPPSLPQAPASPMSALARLFARQRHSDPPGYAESRSDSGARLLSFGRRSISTTATAAAAAAAAAATDDEPTEVRRLDDSLATIVDIPSDSAAAAPSPPPHAFRGGVVGAREPDAAATAAAEPSLASAASDYDNDEDVGYPDSTLDRTSPWGSSRRRRSCPGDDDAFASAAAAAADCSDATLDSAGGRALWLHNHQSRHREYGGKAAGGEMATMGGETDVRADDRRGRLLFLLGFLCFPCWVVAAFSSSRTRWRTPSRVALAVLPFVVAAALLSAFGATRHL